MPQNCDAIKEGWRKPRVFVGAVAEGVDAVHHLENTYLFQRYRDEAGRGVFYLIGEPHQLTPFEFHLGTAQRRPNCRARIGMTPPPHPVLCVLVEKASSSLETSATVGQAPVGGKNSRPGPC